MGKSYIVEELDDIGRLRRYLVGDGETKVFPLLDDDDVGGGGGRGGGGSSRGLGFLKKVFLPSGYPDTVSPDYLRYQVLNALQAFCSSLASLLSSRAVLEGFGVGDPTATATNAMLLTVAQDAFGRLTTIFGAYIFGSSLVAEAKTFRFLADVLNDAAIVLDTLSPSLTSRSLPGIRVLVLCLSSSFRALCGLVAGGAKAAITVHFASPAFGTGDVGDVNAKDSSKETVLALLGMLLGSVIVPNLTTPTLTYTALAILILSHLTINYLGVRGLQLRSMNRQRAGIAWNLYRSSGDNNTTGAPSFAAVNELEPILARPDVFREIGGSGRSTGRCTIGSSFQDVFRGFSSLPPLGLVELFRDERYLLWYDRDCLRQLGGNDWRVVYPIHVHVVLKAGYTPGDQLRAWIHAAELCRSVGRGDGGEEGMSLVRKAYKESGERLPEFVRRMRRAGWNMDDVVLMVGSPKGVLAGIESGDPGEDKKIR